MKGKSEESNFIRHRVRVRIEGFKPEALISAACEKGAACRNIRRLDDTCVELTVTAAGLKILRRQGKSRYKFHLLSEGGTLPLYHRIKAAKMAAAGLVLFILVAAGQALFVREINITGMRGIPEEMLRQTLKEEGLYEGSLKGFDADKIEKRLFLEYENIVWSRLSHEGGYVELEIRETRQKEAEPLGQDVPCNIVAEEDCYIEEVQTYSGRRVAKPGDFVKKGGILIRGKVPIERPSYQLEKDEPAYYFVHAAGRVTARIPYYFSFYLPPEEGKEDAEKALAGWIKENVPENAQILNKDFHFDVKKI